MDRLYTKNATGVAPDGRWFAGDINALQDAVLALLDFSQTLGVGVVEVGESGLQIVKYGTGEMRVTGALRTDGILRGLGGIIYGAFTTTTRNAISAPPYGLVILNTSTNRLEYNAAASGAASWQPVHSPAGLFNADIASAAAIAYSKLALTGSIVNADIGAAAGIVYSKLNLGGHIVNADIDAAAAIVYSKLALGGHVVNADIDAAAAIAYSKLNLAGAVKTTDFNFDVATQAELNAAIATELAARVAADTSLQDQIDDLSGGSIPDGSITEAKLAFDVATQAELDAAIAGVTFPSGSFVTGSVVAENVSDTEPGAQTIDIGSFENPPLIFVNYTGATDPVHQSWTAQIENITTNSFDLYTRSTAGGGDSPTVMWMAVGT